MIPSRPFERLPARCSYTSRKPIGLLIVLSTLLLGSTFSYWRYVSQPSVDLEQITEYTYTFYGNVSSDPSREAYITFLSSSENVNYLNDVRLLLFQLVHDPSTLDPFHRDFVILTTPHVPYHVEDLLRAEGAIIERRPLLEGLPRGHNKEGEWYDEMPNHSWRDQYSKLHIFNMTRYDRLMYLDADHLLVLPIHDLWDDPNSWPVHGLAAFSDAKRRRHPVPVPDGPRLNAGFMVILPSASLFNTITGVRDFEPVEMEQSLLNAYYRRDGPHPWLPLNHIYTSTHPTAKDLDGGVHALHEKFWKRITYEGKIDAPLIEILKEKMGRMDGYWLGTHASHSSTDTNIKTDSYR